jgi:CMP-N-acetylneuraminic acid synthetase
MNIAILQTARCGSVSVPNKNTLSINNKPLFLHNIINAKNSQYKPHVYLSTDISNIESLSSEYGFTIIERPEYLSRSDSSHHETIKHGVEKIEEIQNLTLDIVVVILGNTISAWPEDIDRAIEILQVEDDVDSVISVGKYNMFNPVRSLTISSDGSLDRIIDFDTLSQSVININNNDKDVIGDVYYLNGSLMAMRRAAVFGQSDKLPFTWLGNKTIPIVQKSICMEIDDEWQTNIIKKISDDNSIGK